MTPEILVSVFCPSTTRSDKTRTLFTSPPCGEVGPDREAVPAGWGLFTSPPCGEVGPDREAVPAGWGLFTSPPCGEAGPDREAVPAGGGLTTAEGRVIA